MLIKTSRKFHKYFGLTYLLIGVPLFIYVGLAHPGTFSIVYFGRADIFMTDFSQRVSFKAQKPQQWYWFCPDNFNYRHVTLSIDREKIARIDLINNTWQSANEQGPLTAEYIARLITTKNNVHTMNPELKTKVQQLLQVLRQIKEGDLPPLYCHSRGSESPAISLHNHIKLGRDWGLYIVFAWLFIWPTYLFLFKQPALSAWLTRGLFLAVLLVVIASNSVLYGIENLNNPIVDYLFVALNAPALYLADMGRPLDPLLINFALSQLCWPVLFSVIASIFAAWQPQPPFAPEISESE